MKRTPYSHPFTLTPTGNEPPPSGVPVTDRPLASVDALRRDAMHTAFQHHLTAGYLTSARLALTPMALMASTVFFSYVNIASPRLSRAFYGTRFARIVLGRIPPWGIPMVFGGISAGSAHVAVGKAIDKHMESALVLASLSVEAENCLRKGMAGEIDAAFRKRDDGGEMARVGDGKWAGKAGKMSPDGLARSLSGGTGRDGEFVPQALMERLKEDLEASTRSIIRPFGGLREIAVSRSNTFQIERGFVDVNGTTYIVPAAEKPFAWGENMRSVKLKDLSYLHKVKKKKEREEEEERRQLEEERAKAAQEKKAE